MGKLILGILDQILRKGKKSRAFSIPLDFIQSIHNLSCDIRNINAANVMAIAVKIQWMTLLMISIANPLI